MLGSYDLGWFVAVDPVFTYKVVVCRHYCSLAVRSLEMLLNQSLRMEGLAGTGQTDHDDDHRDYYT